MLYFQWRGSGKTRRLWIMCERRLQAPVLWAPTPRYFPNHSALYLLVEMPPWSGSGPQRGRDHATPITSTHSTLDRAWHTVVCSINTEWPWPHEPGSSQEGGFLPAPRSPHQCWADKWEEQQEADTWSVEAWPGLGRSLSLRGNNSQCSRTGRREIWAMWLPLSVVAVITKTTEIQFSQLWKLDVQDQGNGKSGV